MPYYHSMGQTNNQQVRRSNVFDQSALTLRVKPLGLNAKSIIEKLRIINSFKTLPLLFIRSVHAELSIKAFEQFAVRHLCDMRPS